MNHPIARALERLKSVLRGRKGTDFQLEFTEVGITLKWLNLENESGEHFIEWSQVQTITAYKRDLYTYDLICLLFSSDIGLEFELNEEMPNWQLLIDALPQVLPGCRTYPDWWHPIAIPAFATNESVIYSRIKAMTPPIP